MSNDQVTLNQEETVRKLLLRTEDNYGESSGNEFTLGQLSICRALLAIAEQIAIHNDRQS